MNILEQLGVKVEPVDQSWITKAVGRQNSLTKPPGSLGTLEEIACRMAGIQETLSPRADRKRIVIFAADHGVTEEGVSPYPTEVTAQMVANFLRGGAAINAIATAAGAEVIVVDIGVKSPIPTVDDSRAKIQFIRKPVRSGTRNFTKEAALTETEALAAITLGYEIAKQSKRTRVNLIGLGEMGIGNTTAAAAITAALTGLSPVNVTGRGTGADDEILAKKRSIVSNGIRIHEADLKDPFSILRVFGGLEIAGLVGLCLGAAAARMAIMIDGFITTAAAALAVRLCPASLGYMFAGHLSAEPGHLALLQMLQLSPMLDLRMRLGEGTGAALAMNLMEAALACFRDMATFDDAGVSGKHELAKEAVH
ncbi:MAG TPA: nicotinate-nucleotide--dimethylbenzimidazole phosphoribosyltransferase [Terriglobales bacterium]|jgi:nicotinate-nucleotide--dimethylbenzimidazole phosphoribosyltransferase|nr:nicotinate-nucleotide--dimethylbenzimidazole phosphoribosyltransferase [Terriglobales bacterium]